MNMSKDLEDFAILILLKLGDEQAPRKLKLPPRKIKSKRKRKVKGY